MISIVMATYNRSLILTFSIRSVLQQTREDWELLIIGDHCSDDTELVIQSFQDPRIHFINLEKRVGDQSGPTNFAMQQAKGKYLAFLNHDDLWFPDHLERAIEHLEQTKSDLVYTLQFDAEPDRTVRINSIYGKTFSPLSPPNISTWVCQKKWALKQRPFRPFRELFTYPSIDWLIHAWKQGAQLSCVPAITVLILTSITRQGCYVNKDSTEHDFWFRQMASRADREQLLTKAFLHPRPTHLQGYCFTYLFRALLSKIIKQTLCTLHCNPIAWILYFRCPKKWGIFPMRGALRQKLNRKRGLKIEELCQ